MSFDKSVLSALWQNEAGIATETPADNQRDRVLQSPWSPSPSQVTAPRGLSTSRSSAAHRNIPADSRHPRRAPSLTSSTSISPQASTEYPPIGSHPGRGDSREAGPVPPSSSRLSSSIGQTGVHYQPAQSSIRSTASSRPRGFASASTARGTGGFQGSAIVGGGGGSGVVSRGGSYSYSPATANEGHISPTSTNVSRPTSVSSTAISPSAPQSSFSKISATQVVLLLDTISEKEGKVKWESKATKIRSLLVSNGTEVFAQFLRRAIILNWAIIFDQAQNADQGSYTLLREQVLRILSNSEQAFEIADAVDSAREENFRDFDLLAFARHFFHHPLQQAILAVAFLSCEHSNLLAKANKWLSANEAIILHTLIDRDSEARSSTSSLALTLVIGHYAVSNSLLSREQLEYHDSLATSFGPQFEGTPIMSAISLWNIPEGDRALLDSFKKATPKTLALRAGIENVLQSLGRPLTDREVANALLFLLFSHPASIFQVKDYVACLKKYNVNWNAVVTAFDAPHLRMNTDVFTRLMNGLLPIAQENPQFDIQQLWGGVWQNPHTQISFLKSFMLADPSELHLEQIPNFRSTLDASDFQNVPGDSITHIRPMFESQYRSEDAMRAIVEVVLASDDTAEDSLDGTDILQDLVSKHMSVFMLSLVRIPRPQVVTQEGFLDRCFLLYLQRQPDDWKLVLDALYAQSADHLYSLCTLCFHSDPRRTELIYERAEELGWMNAFLKQTSTPLGLDLACMRHKLSDDFDLDKYLADTIEPMSSADRLIYGNILWKYLRIKADDEFRVQREQRAPQSVPLSLKSVFVFLWKLQDLVSDRDQLKAAQTTCLQTYPRLMNYGTGYDDVLENRSREIGNKLPEHIDKKMSELFGQMYRSEKSIRDMVSDMTQYKTSTNPEYQDLFCCIVHGLFDEYICYSEYPEEALEKTALLFGNIVRYKLLPPVPQDYGLALIIDAVRDNQENTAMHRFGIEALLQISERLPEWPPICQQLLSIPSLTEEAIRDKAIQGLAPDGNAFEGVDGSASGMPMTNGSAGSARGDNDTEPFQALSAEAGSRHGNYHDPDEKAQEKISFVINNLSDDNMDTKLSDLREALRSEHHQWFAAYIVEQRARLEPNNHERYLTFLTKIDDPELNTEVVRETYVSCVKMLNARSTMDSATERNHLKSLGTWLGSLTLARNKAIKHRNIYFVELLQEGFDTQRLVVVIPFTCKVLSQGSRSAVFKPPNPWLMEIISLLMELYHFAELKLNEKFAIEVMCKELGLDHKKVEPASMIRDRPLHLEDAMTTASVLPEGLEGFDELALNGPMSRGVRERISPEEILASFPSLSERLSFPQMQGRPQDQELIRDLITRAFEQAILEIIAPVVERSITIASISTAQLVAKDYSLEPDPERYRTAAKQMVKSLAGSLALVTCKEPLRMSVSNYIRSGLTNNTQLSSDAMPSEGHIMMLLNDNLDKACAYVEKAAEDRALPEIEHVIEADLEDRRRFAVENPGRDFVAPQVSRWSTYIPDPYKQTVGGLNEHQRAVYEDFSHRVHGMNAGHMQNASTDSTGRQIPDVLQEALAMPNMSTPAEQPAIPHQSPIMQQDLRGHSALPQPRINGFADTLSPGDRVAILIEAVQKAARASEAPRIKDMEKNSSIFQDVRQILIILTSAQRPIADHIARQVAEKICHTLITKPPQHPLEAELLAFLLNKLCMLSELIVRDVMRWITASEVELLHSSLVTAALISVGLMDLTRVDGVIAAALKEHNENGLQLLSELMDQTLFCEEPYALRADFANSVIALYGWLKEQPDLQLGVEISLKLKAEGVPEYVNVVLSDKVKAKQDQMQYVFREWASLCENMAYNEGAYATFLKGLHHDQLIHNAEDLAVFLRLCVETCVDGFESEAQSFRGSLTAAFSRTDALALLVILIVKFQGDTDGAVKKSKSRYLESMLDTLVLVLNHHHEIRATAFNQRVFTRLFSSILFEYSAFHLDSAADHDANMAHFARTLTELSPFTFSGFAYGWICLLSNRVFVESMLKSGNAALTKTYKTLFGMAFEFLTMLVDGDHFKGQVDAVHRGLLRIVSVMRQDFADFFVENYAYLCARLSEKCPQLRNLILCTKPSSLNEEPDPLLNGVRLERLEEMKSIAPVAGDANEPLEHAGVLNTLQSIGRKPENVDNAVKHFKEVVVRAEEVATDKTNRVSPVAELHESLVGWTIHDACNRHEKFDAGSAHAKVLIKLAQTIDDFGRYKLLTAISDNIRFASLQTEYALRLFLHLWGTGSGSGSANGNVDATTMREVLLRIIFERLIEPKPHPWGMLALFKELSETQVYGFWETAGFDLQPDLRQRLAAAVRGS